MRFVQSSADGLSVEMRPKYLWLCVTADEYELPLAVAETSTELALMVGTTGDNVREGARRRDTNGSRTGNAEQKRTSSKDI